MYTRGAKRNTRTCVWKKRKRTARRCKRGATHLLLYYTKRYISVKSFLVKKDGREVPWRASRSDSLPVHYTQAGNLSLFYGSDGNQTTQVGLFYPLTHSLARSLFSMYINPPIIKKCGVVLLSLCYTCHKHCVIFAAQAKTAPLF